MGPPPLPDSDINSDSISISDSQTDSLLSRSRSHSRSHSIRSQSIQSGYPQLIGFNPLQDEEIKLQREIAELQQLKRVQDLRKQKEELLQQLK